MTPLRTLIGLALAGALLLVALSSVTTGETVGAVPGEEDTTGEKPEEEPFNKGTDFCWVGEDAGFWYGACGPVDSGGCLVAVVKPGTFDIYFTGNCGGGYNAPGPICPKIQSMFPEKCPTEPPPPEPAGDPTPPPNPTPSGGSAQWAPSTPTPSFGWTPPATHGRSFWAR